MCESKIKYKDRTIYETLYILENQKCCLLSRRTLVELGVVRLIGEITQINTQICEGLGKLERKYYIKMKYGVKPYAIHILRPITIYQQQQKFLQKITKIIGNFKGIIVHVDDILVMGDSQEGTTRFKVSIE